MRKPRAPKPVKVSNARSISPPKGKKSTKSDMMKKAERKVKPYGSS